MRTEFLFGGKIPSEDDEQLRAYRMLVEKSSGKPVSVRLFDLGGDKLLHVPPGLPTSSGLRGIRLLRKMPALLRSQLRALIRACTAGDMRILVPMVSRPEELTLVRDLMAEEAIVKNYAGDVMNFELGAQFSGVDQIATVRISDDISGEDKAQRRGLAGAVVTEKMLGAAAERGFTLPDLVSLAERVGENTRSLGVALTSCVVPSFGSTMFELGEKEIEIGVGIHGVRGRWRSELRPADDLVRDMIDRIDAELKPAAWQQSCLLVVNGLGGTPPSELSLVAGSAVRALEELGYQPQRFLVGSYATSLDAAGCSITICLLDEELLDLWDDPVRSPALRWNA